MWQCPRCEEDLPDGVAGCWICGTLPDGTEDPDFVAEQMPAKPPPATVVTDLPTLAPKTARQLWIEVAVVVVVVILPGLWWSFVSLAIGVPRFGSVVESLDLVVRSVMVSALVLYLLWRSGDPWERFGLSRPRWSDVIVGILVAMAVWLGQRVVLAAVWLAVPDGSREGMSSGFAFASPQSTADWTLFVTAHLSNGFAEELSIRAYLFLRLRQLLGSTTQALLLSSLLFASYHLYQGPWGLIGNFAFGVLIGLAFLKIRRLWPVALAHAAINVYLELTH